MIGMFELVLKWGHFAGTLYEYLTLETQNGFLIKSHQRVGGSGWYHIHKENDHGNTVMQSGWERHGLMTLVFINPVV